ncbi:MAG: lamin tail domain-containing protein [Bacteroidota bacterium]
MRKLFLFLFFLPLGVFAQFTDDFGDGNFTANPVWSGDAAKFEVNTSQQLHLNTTGADTSILCTPSTSVSNTEWRFWVKLSFATSANNNGRVYLVSDQQNIAGSLNGYFVQVGETNDSIALYKQAGTTITRIIPGTIAYTNNSTNTLRIKVTLDNAGNWSLYSDPVGGTNYQLEGTGNDATFTSGAWFGVYCKYTTTNAAKFYFDDFYVGPIQVDLTPPTVLSVGVVSANSLDVVFSEVVGVSTAQTLTNYSADQGLGNPSAAVVDGTNPALVHLTFATNFPEDVNCILSVSNVEDGVGNAMPSAQNLNFVYHRVKTFEVVINEIMADPDPAVGLPSYEYLELYNTTTYPISLYHWKIILNGSEKIFPNVTIQPNGYLILTSTTALLYFTPLGAVQDFSSFSLTNAGMDVVLADTVGHIIHAVSYADTWYQDPNKIDGGWSLEQIDPMNPCGESSNWRAAMSSNGGTPGAINSVNTSNADVVAPQLVRVAIISTTSIQAYFSEPMDSVTLTTLSYFMIDNSIGNPTSISLSAPLYKSVILTLPAALQSGIVYTLAVSTGVTDCKGNTLGANGTARFGIPEVPVANDIVINELLYNPRDGGQKFVELYNRSSKLLDLKDLRLCTYDTVANMINDMTAIAAEGYLVFPEDYVVLTTDPAAVKEQYQTINPNNFVQLATFPSYNSGSGVVGLIDLSMNFIDRFDYSDDMHFPLLSTMDGVSLERVNFNRPTADATNWHSAAQSVGYATPAYKNSEFVADPNVSNEITLSPEVFSPDEDGVDDILNIQYLFNEPGYVANIVIYDSRGRTMRTLINNEMLATSGTFSWDGITDRKEKAPIGIYVLYIEVFDIKGNVKHFKKSCVVAGKFKG